MGSDALVLSHFSVRRADFTERVSAAAAAGYSGIGLYVGEYERLRAAGHSDDDLRTVLDEYGQQITAFEALRGWASSGEGHEVYRRRSETVGRMVDAFGPPHHVQVVGPYEGRLDVAAERFARVCDRLAELGTRAALEYFPQMSNIPNVFTACEIVRRAGRDNGGLCVDSWHHSRTRDTFDDLACVPSERVFSVQFNDGPAIPVHPDYRTDCMSHRLIPGNGDFDLVGFVRTLDAMGVDVPFEVEVVSLELDALAPAEAARRMAEGSRAVLARARAGR
jgi:sugar phosphate isomerase/epimerase